MQEGTESGAGRRVVTLGAGLRAAMGGRRSCHEDELVPLLLANKRLRVVRTFQITVQTMTGRSFGVSLEEGGNATVSVLKSEIQEVEGTAAPRQDLFLLCDGAKEGSEEPLLDDFMLADSCAVALCIAVKPGKWELTSCPLCVDCNCDVFDYFPQIASL